MKFDAFRRRSFRKHCIRSARALVGAECIRFIERNGEGVPKPLYSQCLRASRAQSTIFIEREWLTKWKLPVNGPALTKFPLSVIARYAWKSLPSVINCENLQNAVEDKNQTINTVYWHILDHSRNQGKWQPPIPQSILNH